MISEPTDSRLVYDLKCPVCGCDKPKLWVKGRYQCAGCTCRVESGCSAGSSDG